MDEASASMGPLAKSLMGKGPGGKNLTEQQMKQVREIDGLLANFGNLKSELK